MVPAIPEPPRQLPLLHVVERDDVYLAAHAQVTWFHVLGEFDWRPLIDVAAQYYEALHRFNVEAARRRAGRRAAAPNEETRGQATLRLVAARPTQGGGGAVVAPAAPPPLETVHVVAQRLRPGVVPTRLAGRPPKCFFSMLKAFLGVLLRGRAATPENVHDELVANPAFARTCGFSLPVAPRAAVAAPNVQSDVPSLRKIQQFDELMTARGLWDRVALLAVRDNLLSGRLDVAGTLVHDTTHYEAYSKRTSVTPPGKEEQGATPTKPQHEDENKSKKEEEPRRKSHPRTTKNCRCRDRETCPHAWVSADPGAGTVTKAGGRRYWAHKVSTLSFTTQGVLLDAVAMTDGASHDSKSVVPHLARLFERFPDLRQEIGVLLDDGAADDEGLKAQVRGLFGIELVTSQNTRSRQAITKDLPRGIEKITASGTPVCAAGLPFDFVGCRHDSGHFQFRAPDLEAGRSACEGCPLRDRCCRPGANRRHVMLAFDRLPWLDPALPQLSRSFARLTAARTVIERIHNLMKYVYGEPDLRKRGTASMQATLDKTLWAMHVALARA